MQFRGVLLAVLTELYSHFNTGKSVILAASTHTAKMLVWNRVLDIKSNIWVLNGKICVVVVYGILACGAVFYGNSLAWLMSGTYIHYEISSCKINKSKEFNWAVKWLSTQTCLLYQLRVCDERHLWAIVAKYFVIIAYKSRKESHLGQKEYWFYNLLPFFSFTSLYVLWIGLRGKAFNIFLL